MPKRHAKTPQRYLKALVDIGLGRSNWDTLLSLARTEFNATALHFVAFNSAREITEHEVIGADPSAWREFDAYYGRISPAYEHINSGARFDRVITDFDFITPDEMRRHEFYDWANKYDGYYRFGLEIGDQDDEMLSIWFLRDQKIGPAAPAEAAAVEQLAPGLRHALASRRVLAGAPIFEDRLADSLLTVATPTMAVDESLVLGPHNDAATALLRRGDGVRFCRGKIALGLVEDDIALRLLVRSGAPGEAQARRRSDAPPLRIISSPLPRLVGPWGREAPGAVLKFIDPLRTPVGLRRFLQSRFPLTRAEIEVAMRLTEGMSIDEIARARGTGAEAVRSHVQQIHLKLGVKGRARFMAMMLRCVDERDFTGE